MIRLAGLLVGQDWRSQLLDGMTERIVANIVQQRGGRAVRLASSLNHPAP